MGTDDKDYSKEPPSISELRGMRSKSSKDWKPRDALIAALRAIDSGEDDCRAIFICQAIGDEWKSAYYSAGLNNLESTGLLEMCKIMVWEGGK